jgi:hypothetical protein
MEGIEEAVDRLDQRLAAMSKGTIDDRLAAVDSQLSKLAVEISNLAGGLDAAPSPLPREQERLKVDEAAPAPPRRRTAKKQT